MADVRFACSNKPRASNADSSRTKGHWSREVYHALASGMRSECGSDASEWLRIDDLSLSKGGLSNEVSERRLGACLQNYARRSDSHSRLRGWEPRHMSSRITIERILRDDDDASGQTIRQWKIETEGGHITVRDREEHIPFLMLRPADIEIFIEDLRKARTLASPASADAEKGKE